MSLSKTIFRVVVGFAAAIMFSASAMAQSTILSPLQTRGKSLEAQLKGKTRASLQGDTALQDQIKSFQKDQQAIAVDLQYKQKELQITESSDT